MGCFTACFHGCLSKHSKPKKKYPSATHRKDHQNFCHTDPIKEALLCTNQATQEAQIAETVKTDAAIKEKNEDKLNSSARKKITFDLNAKTPERSLGVQEAAGNLSVENNENRTREEGKDEVFRTIICSSEKGEEKEKRKQSKDEADLVSDSSVSSLFSYPPNLRFQNCTSSDDDSVDMDFNQSHLVDVVADKTDEDRIYKDKNGCEEFELVQEESSESLFSLSIDSRKQNSAVDLDVGEKEVCSPLKPPCEKNTNNQNARERIRYVQSVLNPVENLSQWKAVRAKTTAPKTHQEEENIHLEQEPREKENLNLEEDDATFVFGELPSFKRSPEQGSGRFSNRPKDDEITVDTSLSSWLMGSEKALTNENSPGSVANTFSNRTTTPKSFEDDRPILGALTVEELKHLSKASSPSPKRSPSHSPDEMPIIGTVGSYWRRTAKPIDADLGSSGKGTSSASSMSRFCKKAGMDSTPIQTRLERALEDVAAQV